MFAPKPLWSHRLKRWAAEFPAARQPFALLSVVPGSRDSVSDVCLKLRSEPQDKPCRQTHVECARPAVARLCDCPRTISWMRTLARRLATQVGERARGEALPLNPLAVLVHASWALATPDLRGCSKALVQGFRWRDFAPALTCSRHAYGLMLAAAGLAYFVGHIVEVGGV